MLNLSDFRSVAQGLNDLLPWAALIEPGVVLQKDGSMLACWEIRGDDTDSARAERLNYVSERANASMLALGTGWAVFADAVRMPEKSYPEPGASHFPDRVSAMIDDERRATFSSGKFYTTRTVLTAVYKAPPLADQLVAVAVDSDVKRANALEKSGSSTFTVEIALKAMQ